MELYVNEATIKFLNLQKKLYPWIINYDIFIKLE